ncbi:unnamed protein product [Aphanomyces euteiches]
MSISLINGTTAYYYGNEPQADGSCLASQIDCNNCDATTTAAPTTAPTSTSSSTTTSPSSANGKSTPQPNSSKGNQTTTQVPGSIPMDSTLQMWQIGLCVGSGVLMLIVITCVLVSLRRAWIASKSEDESEVVQDDARFYRENYRSQTTQQPSRRPTMTQSMMEPRRMPPTSAASASDVQRRNTDNIPIASF